jgi:membrane protease YdiL (CAAX protease family)
VLQEIAQASQPQEDSADWTAWRKNPGSALILIWWGLELSSAMAILVTGPDHLERVLIDPGVMEVWLFKGGLMLVAAFLGIRVVRQVERSQGERWDAIQAWPPVQEDPAPPPPEEKTPPWMEARQGVQWETLDVFPSVREIQVRPLSPVEETPAPVESSGDSSLPLLKGLVPLLLGALTLIVTAASAQPSQFLIYSAGALALVGAVMARPAGVSLFSALAFKPAPRAVWGAAVLLGFGGFLFWEGAIAPLTLSGSSRFIGLLTQPFGRFGIGGMLLIFGLAFPFAEEVLFRGVVLPAFLSKWPPLKAVLVTGVLCAVIHIHPAAVLTAALQGIACGFARVLTGSLWPAVAIHTVHNVALVLLGINSEGLFLLTPDVVLLGLLFWGLGLWTLFRATDGLRLPAVDKWVEWLKPPQQLRTDGPFLRARLLTVASLLAALLIAVYNSYAILKGLADPFYGSLEIGIQCALAWAAFRGSRAASLFPIALFLTRLGLLWGALQPVQGYGAGLLLVLCSLGAVGVFTQHRLLTLPSTEPPPPPSKPPRRG